MSEKGRTRKDLYGEYGKEGPLFLLNGHHCLEVRSCFAYDSGYPSFAAREMCDYDILFDSKRAIDVKSIMESLGFQVKAFGEFKEDVYHKPPVSNIEMHRMLFGEKHDTKLVEYYKDVKSRLLKDENNGNSASLHMPGGILRNAASLLLSRDAMPTPRMKMHRRQGKKR